MNVSIIAVPFDSGHRDTRMGRGPAALLGAGLAAQLEHAGATVSVTFVDLPASTFCSEITAAFALQSEVARLVASARAEGSFPLVLAGNCNTAVGTVAGMLATREEMPVVCWFDAHADFNTPETTTSGFLDGMAVSMLTGHSWQSMTANVPGFHPVPDANVVMIGVRDVDGAEAALLDGTPIARVGTARTAAQLDAALERAADSGEAYLHLDLDVLDPSVGHANHYAVPDGLDGEGLFDSVARIQQKLPIGAMALTAYDPAADRGGRVAAAAVAVAAQVVERARR